MSSADFCVCCGATVPEGRQTCLECEKAASKKESLYDDVCRALTDYEHASDPETPKQAKLCRGILSFTRKGISGASNKLINCPVEITYHGCERRSGSKVRSFRVAPWA